MANLNQARRDMIWKLRAKGLTFAAIGKRLDPPASRQLVHSQWSKMYLETLHKVVDKDARKAYK